MVSDALKKAKKKYEQNNREKTNIDNYKRTTRMYILKYATSKDLIELEKLISEKINSKVDWWKVSYELDSLLRKSKHWEDFFIMRDLRHVKMDIK